MKYKEITCAVLGTIIPITGSLFISGREITAGIREAIGENSLHAIKASLNMTSLLLCLVIFLLIPALSNRRDESKIPQHPKGNSDGGLYKKLLLGLLIPSLIFGTIIYIGNPRGYYAPRIFPTRVIDARYHKFQAYKQLAEPPDVLILGSSVSMRLLPYRVQKETGYTTFNWGVESGGMTDLSIIIRFIANKQPTLIPKVLLVEIYPSFTYNAISLVGASSPMELFRYMDLRVGISGFSEKVKGLFSRHQAEEVFYVVNALLREKTLPTGVVFDQAGAEGVIINDKLEIFDKELADRIFNKQDMVGKYESDLQEQIDKKAFIPECEELDPFSVIRVNEFFQLSQEKGFSIIFFFAPRNPVFYDAVIEGNIQYNHCKDLTYEYLKGAQQDYKNIFVLDFTKIESFSGLPGVEGFYDSIHLTPENANRLISTVAPTIVEAYQVAVKLRNSP